MNYFNESKANKEELLKFQGTWVRIQAEVDKITVPHFVPVDSTMVIIDNRAIITEGGQTFEIDILRLNSDTNPKQIDTKSVNDPEDNSVALGIYELEDDMFRMCHTWKGQAIRPDKFEIPEGSGLVQSLWKRIKK